MTMRSKALLTAAAMLLAVVVLLSLLGGCAVGNAVRSSRAPDAEPLPAVLAVHPILSSPLARGGGARPGEDRVVAAYLRVIDTRSLEVLAQVSLSYDVTGRGLVQLADAMAGELAGMAGLVE